MLSSRSLLSCVIAVLVFEGCVLSAPTISEADGVEVQCVEVEVDAKKKKSKGKKKGDDTNMQTWVSAKGYGAALQDKVPYCGEGQCKLLQDGKVWCAPDNDTIITASRTCTKDGVKVDCVPGDPDACVRIKERSTVTCHAF